MALSHILPIDARYFGTDADPEPITWAQQNITAAVPNFWFYPMEIGLEGLGPAALPLDDSSQDLIFCFRITTRIYPEPLALHLREFEILCHVLTWLFGVIRATRWMSSMVLVFWITMKTISSPERGE